MYKYNYILRHAEGMWDCCTYNTYGLKIKYTRYNHSKLIKLQNMSIKIWLPFQRHCCGWPQNSFHGSFEVLWELSLCVLGSRYQIEDPFFLPAVGSACNQRGCSLQKYYQCNAHCRSKMTVTTKLKNCTSSYTF